MEIDPVILQLKADIDGLSSGLTRAQSLTDQKLAAIERRGVQMGEGLRRGFSAAGVAAAGFVAAISVQQIGQVIGNALDYASSLGEVAQQLGVTTDALQEYRFAATQVGLQQEEMDQALSQLTRRIGEAANGTKAQAQAFNTLGISVKGANGQVIATGEAIPMIAEALTKVESPAKRAAILMDLFGRSGQKLEPLLSGGSAAVNQLRDAAHRLGIVLSSQQIQNADDAADKLAAVKTVLSARIAGIVADNSSAIMGLADAFESIVSAAGRAANAYRRFMLEAKVRMADNVQNGWASKFIYSPAQIEDARRQGDEARKELNAMTGRAGGGFKSAQTVLSGNLDLGGAAAAGGGATPSPAATKGGGASGPTAAEITSRYNDERAAIMARYNSALAAMARSAEEQAELELRNVDLDRIRSIDAVKSNADYSAARKAQLIAQIESLADVERERVEREKAIRLEQEAAQRAQAQFDAQREALQAQYDLADTQDERRQIALEMVDAEYRYLRSVQDAIIASETATQAEKDRAKIIRDSLDASVAGRTASAERANAGPLEAWARQNGSGYDVRTRAEEAVVAELERVREGIHGALSDAMGVKDPLISFLLDNLLQELLFKPIADALSKKKGGGGGGLLSSVVSIGASLFGRASGGRVDAGQIYRVNEASSPGNVELFRPDVGGQIIPLGRTNAVAPASQGQGAAVVRLELSGDIDARIQQVSGPIAVEVVRASVPSLIDASANETMRRANRPRI